MVYRLSFGGFLVVGGGVILALAMVALMRRLLSAEMLRNAHDATASLLSIVGTLYAVLLGLIVVDAMVRFERAMDEVQSESNCLADIFLLAERLPEPQRTRVRERCRLYAEQVVKLEWPLMTQARMSVEARRSALGIAQALDDFEPVTEAQKVIYPMVLEQARDLWDLRRDRANAVQFGIPVVEWTALLIGALVTLFFVGLFSVDHAGLQHLLTGLSALVIGLNLYLVSLFGYPFSGDLTVSKRPFELDIAVFDGAFHEGPAHDGEAHAPR